VRTAADARDLAAGESPADRPVLAEYFPIAEHVWKAVGRRLRCDYHRAGRESASLQKEGYKYVWSSSGDHELFDLAADPAEERSVLRDRPEVAARLDAELKAWRTRLRAPRREGLPDVIDPATRKALESLGYVN
jgi:hypothetical protein